MERERRRREKSFLFFFFFLYFLPFFFFVSVYLSSSFLGAHPPSDLYWLGKIQPTYSQTLPAAAQCCQALFYIFLFVVLRRFFWRAATYSKKKKGDDDAEVLGPSRKVVSSPPEKIWKYFPINLFTLNKMREREKAQRRFTRYDNCICTAKNTSSAAMLLPLSSRVKPCCCAVSTRRIHRLTDADW